MNKNDFIHQCVWLGYATQKQATVWVKYNFKEEYTDDDLIKVYRTFDDWSNVYNGRFELGDGATGTRYNNWDEEY